jgi:SulP family sulfate permease
MLILAGAGLIDIQGWLAMYKIDRTAAAFSLITTAGVLLVGVLPGIIVGILLSLAYLIQFMARPFDAVLSEVAGRKGFHDAASVNPRYLSGILVYRFYAPLLFANCSYFFDRINQLLIQNGPTHWVLIDAQAMTFLDVTAAEQLLALKCKLADEGIELKFARCNRPLREALDRYGVTEAIGAASFYYHVHDALAAYRQQYGDHNERDDFFD